MKQFHDLNEAELVALTPEQIAYYTDLDCAERGFPLLPPEPIKPEVPTYEPDMEVYIVGGPYSELVICLDEDEAREIAETINSAKRCTTPYVAGWTGPKQVRRDDTDTVLVRPLKAFSETLASTHRAELQRAHDLQKTYNEDQIAYDKAKRARAYSVDTITAMIEAAHATVRRRERLRAQFERYLTLANGNEAIAVRFLVNAEPDTFELLPELKDKEAK